MGNLVTSNAKVSHTHAVCEPLAQFRSSESKLLKTGTSYLLGRKGQPLLVNNKKVSQEHCEFMTGPFGAEDVVRIALQTRNA